MVVASVCQVQGLVNTFGDLRGSFAAIERINSILNAVDIDEALAYGLERDIHTKKVQDENLRLFLSSGPDVNVRHLDKYYMSDLKSTNNLRTLTWAGDVCLDGKIRPRKLSSYHHTSRSPKLPLN